MTLYYPDVSSFQSGVSFSGAPAACVKCTEGTGYVSPDYGPAKSRAAQAGALFFAYHFLHAGSAAAQAAHCHGVAGSTPLMLDWEATTGSNPGMADAEAFIDEYRRLGGTVNLAYLPRWYWSGTLGSPSLSPLASRKVGVVSSSYSAYSDDAHAVGWLPYGGITPSVWQYTDSHNFNNHFCDFNAFRGSLDQFRALVTGGAPAPPAGKAPPFPYSSSDYLGQPSSDPHCHSGFFGGQDNVNVHTWQAQMARRGWSIAQDGRYGPASEQVCRSFQAEKNLGADGLVGPQTWSASWTAPVT